MKPNADSELLAGSVSARIEPVATRSGDSIRTLTLPADIGKLALGVKLRGVLAKMHRTMNPK